MLGFFSCFFVLFLFAYSHYSLPLISGVKAAYAQHLIPTLVHVRGFAPSTMTVLGVGQQGNVGRAGLPLSRSVTLGKL